MASRDAKQVKAHLESTEEEFKNTAIPAMGGNDSQNRFPAKYFSPSEAEKRVRLIQEYTGWLNKEKSLPTLYQPTQSDIDVLMKKDAEKELLNFESFLQQYFDLDNPLHQKLLLELYPNYFDRRFQVIQEKLKLQERIAHLKLFGPQTKEDIFFMYSLYNGDIDWPEGAVFDTKVDETKSQKAFNRGFFNYKKWASPGHAINKIGDTPIFKASGKLNQGPQMEDRYGMFGTSSRETAGAGLSNNAAGVWQKAFGRRGSPEETTST
jgi:hypothetical protein